MSKPRITLLWLAIAPALLAGCREHPTTPEKAPNYGQFVGHVKTEWQVDGRTMRVLEDFAYLDPRGKLWIAPAESIVDGASIPKAFWSTVGGPFEGKYRNASVVHDVECDRKKEPWEAVHKMFYEACLCGGAEPWRAKVMYAAVYQFGPRWVLRSVMELHIGLDGSDETITRSVKEMLPPRPSPTDDQVRAITDYVKSHDPSMEEIERMDLSKMTGTGGVQP